MQNKETKKTESAPKIKTQKSFWPFLILSAVIFVLFIFAGVWFVNRVNTIVYKNAQIGQQTYKLEVAQTEEARQKGLSEREKLANNTGMLFDFKQNGDWRMWMVQMRFAIDIAWLDDNYKIIKIKSNAQPGDYPEVYYASKPSRYVIEVNNGVFESLGVKEGDTVILN